MNICGRPFWYYREYCITYYCVCVKRLWRTWSTRGAFSPVFDWTKEVFISKGNYFLLLRWKPFASIERSLLSGRPTSSIFNSAHLSHCLLILFHVALIYGRRHARGALQTRAYLNCGTGRNFPRFSSLSRFDFLKRRWKTCYFISRKFPAVRARILDDISVHGVFLKLILAYGKLVFAFVLSNRSVS